MEDPSDILSLYIISLGCILPGLSSVRRRHVRSLVFRCIKLHLIPITLHNRQSDRAIFPGTAARGWVRGVRD